MDYKKFCKLFNTYWAHTGLVAEAVGDRVEVIGSYRSYRGIWDELLYSSEPCGISVKKSKYDCLRDLIESSGFSITRLGHDRFYIS